MAFNMDRPKRPFFQLKTPPKKDESSQDVQEEPPNKTFKDKIDFFEKSFEDAGKFLNSFSVYD